MASGGSFPAAGDRLNPSFSWSHYSLGMALAGQRRWEDAQTAYRQAQTLEPGMVQVDAKLAEVLEQLIRENPRAVEFYRALAEVRIKLERREEAIASYQMALQIEPGDRACLLGLADLVSSADPAQAKQLRSRLVESEAAAISLQEITQAQQLLNPALVKRLLSSTQLFDPAYYQASHQLSFEPGSDALEHYIQVGASLGYRPNPLFDAAYYLEQAREAAELGVNPLAHYYLFGRSQQHSPHPFFCHGFYLEEHEDVAATEICPLEHYLAYGAQEGRTAFAASQFTALLQQQTPSDADYLACLNHNRLDVSSRLSATQACQTLGIYCSSLGNYFIAEIADFIAAALERNGHQVVRLSESDQPPSHLNGHIVVAPHEFFYLGEGLQRAGDTDWWVGATMVNVEQPQTTWFSKAFHFLRRAKLILDINVKSASILRELGLPVQYLPLGYLENYQPFIGTEALPDLLAVRSLSPQVRRERPAIDAPLSERPIDLHFVGTLNPRREQFFAQAASWLHQYRCFLHIPPMGEPFIKGKGQALDTDAVVGLSRRSKILLNVHRDELPYFEWHRIVFHGLWQNTLVVTEPCHDVPGLEPNVHFIACPLGEMGNKIRWLLQTPEGVAEAERVRQAGYLAIRKAFQLDQLVMRLI
ncbi:MAG: hypothetical protein HC824_04925 [Synechococcales cyanobacterium RM1_1_8]|nr:hypothetical protein [Synechococcales cyanobacterium RM1_1_8]